MSLKTNLMDNYNRVNLSFVKGKGSTLFDENRRDFIDFSSGIGVCSLGYSDKKLVKSIKKQSKKLIHSSNIFKIKEQETLASMISSLLGFQTYAFFCNSGAEANECAIKLARKYGARNFKEKKYEILTLQSSFHGRTLATLRATGQDKFHTDDFSPYIDGFKFYKDIDEIIENISSKTVGVMIELVQGEGGVKPLDIEKVQKLAKVLEEKSLLLITDEIQCGVFRTGEFVASKIYKIKPDIISFAKGLGGGIAIGACVSKNSIFEKGDHGSTFGGNQLATSSAICVLKELIKLKKSGEIDKNITLFTKNLDKLVKKYPNLIEKRLGLGLMQGLVLKDEKYLNLIYQKALEKRVLILKSGTKTLRFLPPLNISKKEIELGFKRLKKALDEI